MSGQAAVQTQTAAKTTITPITSGVLQRQCACGQHTSAGGECEECKQKREGTLQRAAINPARVHEVLRSPGQPLDAATRAFMEPRFGHDFSGVRVHTDAKAAESARAVNALAYTVGQSIVFGARQHTPHTNAGKKLMAHELAHVVQQGCTLSVAARVSIPGDASEREADQFANSIAVTQSPSETAIHSSLPVLQRSVDSSSSSGSSGGGGGGAIPNPVPREEGTCDCRLDLCWRPIQAYWGIVGALGYKHGFINVIDSNCQTHNFYVDPSVHKAGSESHSHAVDSTPGWDTSGEACATLNTSSSAITCAHIDRLAASTARYEAMDVAYDARNGPNSNSFLEWILTDVGISVSGVPSGLQAWDYYIRNPSRRGSPPRVTRAAAPATTPSPNPVPAPP